MVMGRNQAGIDHAAAGIEPAFARLGRKLAHGDDHAVAKADRTAGPHRGASAPGEDAGRVLDQQCGHVSTPISLSCQFDSASFDRTTMAPNSATPVSVIKNS